MKRLIVSIVLVSLAAFGQSALAGSPGWSLPVTLYADQDIDVGDVYVCDNGATLKVRFDSDADWEIVQAHAASANTCPGLPQTRKGNPKVGKFQGSAVYALPGTDEVTLTVTNPGGTSPDCIAAHAVVYDASLISDPAITDAQIACDAATPFGAPTVDGEVTAQDAFDCSEESAWGAGTEFRDDRNWAEHFNFADNDNYECP